MTLVPCECVLELGWKSVVFGRRERSVFEDEGRRGLLDLGVRIESGRVNAVDVSTAGYQYR